MSVSDLKILLSAFSNFLAFDQSQEHDFSQCGQALLGLGKQSIPDDYAEFLSVVSNGLSLDGICFFGTLDHTPVDKNGKEKPYTIPSLATIAEAFSDFKWLENYLIIGQFFGLFIVYDYANRYYETINASTFRTVDAYATFENMFYALISKRTEDSGAA